MQKLIKIFVLFLFLAGAVFAVSNHGNHNSLRAKNNTSKNLYVNNCARCHGADGKGDTEMGRLHDASDLTSRNVQKMSRKKLTRVITNGTGEMPSFGKKLKSQEIASLVSYVRSL